MNAELLLQHYEKIAEAPDAIPKLRRFILDLAVRGKLVPQDPKDEPAEELLKRIGKVQERVNTGTRVKLKSHPPIETASYSKSVNLPHTWTMARFEQIASIQSNLVDPRHYESLPHIAPDNIESGTGKLLDYKTIAESGVFSAKHLFRSGCLLYSKIRPALAKVVSIDIDGLCSADMYPIAPRINREYLKLFMLSGIFVDQSTAQDNRVAMPKINQASLAKVLVAVPPLAEQQRIVAKVDELMKICDRLEGARKEREAIRDGFTASTLGRLSVADESTFRSDASFAIEHLRELTTRPDQIKQLRQTILNLAVRGKLVPQDPNDEPAAELLKRIDRQSLIGKKTRNTNKNNSESQPASTSVTQYDLPDNWVWASFEQVAVIKSNLVNPKNYKTYPHIAPDTIESETGKLLPFATVGESGVFSAKHYFKSGSLLYSKIRPALAKVVSIDIDGLCSADMYPIHALIDREYLKSYMLSDIFVTQSTVEDNRVAMPKINQHALAKILVAVPPIKEQKRIVGALDVIWVHLDSLKSSLVDVSELKERYSTTNIRWYCV